VVPKAGPDKANNGQQIAAAAEDLRSFVTSRMGTHRPSNSFSAMSR
jgi:hypothetical protein